MNKDKSLTNHILIFWLILFGVLLYTSTKIFISILIGLGVGILISPSLNYLQRKLKFPKAFSVLLFGLGIFLIGIGFIYGISTVISDQLDTFVERIPKISKDLNEKVSVFFQNYPSIKEELGQLNFGKAFKSTSTRLFSGVKSTFQNLALAGFAVVISMYYAVSSKYYFNSLLKSLPASKRSQAEKILKKCSQSLRTWFKTQLIIMVILGVITSLGLWGIGVEYWALFGIMMAFFSLVPYVGVIIVVFFAVLITLSTNASLVPGVLIIFLVTQQIEGNLIIPLLMKERLSMPEVTLLIFILLLGTWLGIIGIFIAPPLFAVLKVFYDELYLPKVERA